MRVHPYIFFALVFYILNAVVTNYWIETGNLFNEEQASRFYNSCNMAIQSCLSYGLYKAVHAREKFVRSAAFFLFALSLNDFLDELFFNPYEMQANEIVLLIILGWLIKTNFYARKS